MAGREKRWVCFDHELKIEACRFIGVRQKFPNHFHEYYVLGFVERGRRHLTCKNRNYNIDGGDLLIFNPLDNHACAQLDDRPLDWRSLNINEDVMRETARQITGREYLPKFTTTVARRSEAAPLLRELHGLIMERGGGFEKEELFYFLIEQLINDYTEPSRERPEAAGEAIKRACAHMEINFAEPITLNDLSRISGLNKYTLLRNFTKRLGVTPYQYLETIRISAAKKLLEKGADPLSAAMRTGFADQSHFTRFFKKLIGLTPRQYGNIFKEL